MELPELQQGLQDIQQAQLSPDAAPSAEAPWLSMDNLMQGYGNWFDNDKGLGEMLLGQLRARGVDTQAATEAMLRELLQGLVDDLNTLQQKLTGFTAAITQQMQQTQAVADSVQAALDSQKPNLAALQMQPPVGAEMPQMNDIPPDIGVDMGEVPSDQAVGDTSPEQPPVTDEVPSDQAAGGTSPEQPPVTDEVPSDQAAGGTSPEGTTSDVRVKQLVSDRRAKSIKQLVSDRRAKSIKKDVSNKKDCTTLNPRILSACKGGY